MLGHSPAFRLAERTLRRLAHLRRPVLLRGETGTGKELAARYLHELGARRGGPFVAVNCGAIVDGLAESELFGHVKGAFTGAHRVHVGAFVRADRGTLFLDEIGELPPPLQAKLLRVLETSRVHPVGGEEAVAVDTRIVCATHRDLEAMVAAGAWREDLYHRLGVLVVHLPPLRERPEDIPLLLERFAREAAEEMGRPVLLAPEAIEAARRHPWPGNVRALKNAVLRAAALVDGPLGVAELLGGPSPPTAGASSTAAPAELPPPRWARAALPSAATDPVTGRHASESERPITPPLPEPPGLVIGRGDWASMNRELLVRSLAEHGSIRRAAVALGIPRSTLGAWLKRARIRR